MRLNCCVCGGLEIILFLIFVPIYKKLKNRHKKHHEKCEDCSCSRKIEEINNE